MNAMKQDTTAKLADVEAKMRRWHSRLTRASNALQKLERQRRRLLLQQQVGVGRPVKAKPSVETDHMAEAEFQQFAETEDPLKIPPMLDRRDNVRKTAERMQAKADEQLVDKLKQRRAAQVEADKKKMPLTGKDAMAAIKSAAPKKGRKNVSAHP